MDAAHGGADYALVGRLHLSPVVQILEQAEDRILLAVGNTQRWLLPTPGVMLEVSAGWYCDRFGMRTRIPVFVYRPADGDVQDRPFGWALSPTPDVQVAITRAAAGHHEVRIVSDDFSDVFSQHFPV